MTVLQDLRVLVVENDEMSAALLQMQLVHAGATVVGLAASVAKRCACWRSRAGRGPARLPPGPQRDQRAGGCSAVGARVPFVLATGMLAEQLPAPMLAGVLLVKPYLSADLSQALVRAVGRASARPDWRALKRWAYAAGPECSGLQGEWHEEVDQAHGCCGCPFDGGLRWYGLCRVVRPALFPALQELHRAGGEVEQCLQEQAFCEEAMCGGNP
jgi:hypothetical protein